MFSFLRRGKSRRSSIIVSSNEGEIEIPYTRLKKIRATIFPEDTSCFSVDVKGRKNISDDLDVRSVNNFIRNHSLIIKSKSHQNVVYDLPL